MISYFEGMKADMLRMIRDRRSNELRQLHREIEEIEREIEKKLAQERELDRRIARLEFETIESRPCFYRGNAR